jgi:GMP synthase (glutamine-hydrolysing)
MLCDIGFSPLSLTDAGMAGPLRHLSGHPVLHWHGDTFAIPSGATHLASTRVCTNQAFAIGAAVMGVQFHFEVDTLQGSERWLIGRAREIAAAGIDPICLRADALEYGPALRAAGQTMFREWLGGL